MKKAWQMTQEEWELLPYSDQVKHDTGYPPYPYHSNFHLMQVVYALYAREEVPLQVLESLSPNSAIDRVLNELRG